MVLMTSDIGEVNVTIHKPKKTVSASWNISGYFIFRYSIYSTAQKIPILRCILAVRVTASKI
jgi:hypothetical protein